jgi:tRNA nucleotidyltransferase (CCA-adding enzyme)
MLDRLEPGQLTLLRAIGRVAESRGGVAYLVGGVVRDLLLARETRDLDVVIDGDAIAVAAELARARQARLTIHRRFLTARLSWPSGERLDVANARQERYPRPAALPEVRPSSIEPDLLRRDFSVNAIALSLAPRSFGTLSDPSGGLEDLEAGRLRVLHPRSFRDDPTRAYRAVRFATRLRFRIDNESSAWMHEAVRSGLVDRVSGTRLRRELESLFEETSWVRCLRAMSRYGLLTAIDQALDYAPGDDSAIRRLERSLDRPHAREARRCLACLMLLLLRRSLPERGRVVRRLSPRREYVRTLEELPRVRRLIDRLGRDPEPDRGRIFELSDGLSAESVLLAAAFSTRVEARRWLTRYLERDRGARPDIDGRDLLAAGVLPGPGVAAGLRAALLAKLKGRARTRPEQLAIATRTARRA